METVGPVSSVEDALTIVTSGEHLHGAVLDVDLRGGLTFPVADELVARGIPFVVLTGHNSLAIPPRFSHVIVCDKPMPPDQVVAALDAC